MTAPVPATGCSVRPDIAARPKTVSVNGTVSPREAIARETQNHPATKPIEAWQAAVRALAIRELLRQEAERLGVAAEALVDDEGRRETDEEARIRALIERAVPAPVPTEEECRRYYAHNLRRFRTPELHEVAHILLPSGEGAREKAAALAGELAVRHSACPSREVGGSLGQIGPGQTVPEFEAALARLEPGRVAAEPVESRYGFHIVRLDRRIEGRELPFEHVATKIAAYLAERSQRTALRQYVSILAGKAELVGVELDAATTPLVQ